MLTRRSFVSGAACAAGLVAVGGASTLSKNESLLRPPGGQDDAAFYGACIRCDRCRSVCPQNCIALSTVNDGFLEARTPKMDFHEGYCDFCTTANGGVPLCHEVCPTNVFSSFDPHADKIGVAVVDEELCIAWARGGCDECFESCQYDALYLDDSSRPHIDADACNGCGECVYDCTANVYRSYNGSSVRAIEVHRVEEA